MYLDQVKHTTHRAVPIPIPPTHHKCLTTMSTRKLIKPSCPLKLLYISMASLFSFALILFLVLFFTLSSASRHHGAPKSDGGGGGGLPLSARNACKVSADPSMCESQLASSDLIPPNPTAVQIIEAAMGVSSQKLQQAKSMVNDILNRSQQNHNRTVAAETCLELYGYVEPRMKSVGEALQSGKIKDARAWMSAVLVYHYDCWSALKYVNETSQVNRTMAFTWALLGFTGDALGMLVNYDQVGGDTGSWGPPKTERDGFWEKGDGSGSVINGGVPSGLTPDVTVCKQGSCSFEKVQDAVNAAPDRSPTQKFVILIKAGLYEEIVRVPFNKTNVVFLGEGMGKTIIAGDLNVGLGGITTYHSATVAVNGDGFMARDLTIKNTAGIGAQQAVALRLDSDRSVIENCEFIGNQDTLYAHSLRQYYKSCHIQGNVDFIFGNSAAVFHECQISVALRQLKPEKPANNAVTAHGRILAAQSTGFVFWGSKINGTEEYMRLYVQNPNKFNTTYLGRPWKEYSRTVFIDCTLGDLISRAGWFPWNGDFALNTLYYGEFGSKNGDGMAVDTSGRVKWSSQIPAAHVSSYSLQNFIQADEWIPTSRVLAAFKTN
ncbi:unnamed protein product [Cuscuta europaea]|uniref:pectinesterase n=1 Tax=Cuscuta europaea TaxID=41803 RepID=A0A9P1EK41_CUSEU|nr:unnamed protein product [Cuscuta europaea]